MHYDGKLTYVVNDDLYYVGGKVQFWDWVDSDFISLFDLDSFLVDAGYLYQVEVNSIEEYRMNNACSYFWLKRKKSMMNGLVEMSSDKEVYEMSADVVKDCNFVRVFLIKKEELR
ncbi:hypothetical protein LINPERPRIM_LOCUS28092 [Linum perenne]